MKSSKMNHLKFQAKKYLNFSTSYLNSFRTENGQNFLNVAHQFVRENITYVVIRWIFAPKIQNFKHWKMRLFGEIFNHYNILNFIVDFKIPGLSSLAFWVWWILGVDSGLARARARPERFFQAFFRLKACPTRAWNCKARRAWSLKIFGPIHP